MNVNSTHIIKTWLKKAVADKNDSKTLDTHAVNTKGKIARKE